MAAGNIRFTVLVRRTTAVENLKRLANQGSGAAVTPGGGVFSVTFTRTGCAAWRGGGERSPCRPRRRLEPCLWARDIIGDGDRELGANLMHVLLHSGPGGGTSLARCSS